MAYKNIKKIGKKNYNFYKILPVNWSQFGESDGYS